MCNKFFEKTIKVAETTIINIPQNSSLTPSLKEISGEGKEENGLTIYSTAWLE